MLLTAPLPLDGSRWQGVAKVADLGFSRPVDPLTGLVPMKDAGTLPYMAPELLDASPGFVTKAIDVYAFGMLMWELFHLRLAFEAVPDDVFRAAMAEGGLRPLCSAAMEPGYKAIMLACMETDPLARPSMAMLEHYLELLASC